MAMYCPLCEREVQPKSPVTLGMIFIAIVVVVLIFAVVGLFMAVIIGGAALITTNFMKRKCPICGATELKKMGS